jgi:hypothetical protein
MIDAQREPLEGVVEVDQTEIPFRADDSFFDPVKSGKILIAGAVEVIDRGTNQAKPRRKRAKYLDTRSGRIRLAAIPDNPAASIEAFVRANVKTGTTLLTDGHRSYPGLTDYRHDRRTVGKVAGQSSAATIPAKGCRQSGANRAAAGQLPACGQTDQDLPTKSNPAPFRIRPASPRLINLGQRDERSKM